MKTLYRFLILTLLASQFINAQSTIHLFNGNNLDGWYAFEPETGKHDDALELFAVEDSTIRLYGSKAGYLMSEESFKNFELTAQFRWNTDTSFVRKSNNINSGLMYLIPQNTPDELWPKGIQFQIKKGATGDFIFLQDVTLEINGTRNEPGKSVVSQRFINAANPIGEWNTIVITSKEGYIKQELNGQLVNEGNKPSVTEGRILLQYEGLPIDFRKIGMKNLD